MMTLTWLDETDPAVRSAVVSGAWGKAPHSAHGDAVPTDADAIDQIADALRMASEHLARLTGFTIHPAGSADEEFVATEQVSHLSLQMSPVRLIRTVKVRDATLGILVPFDGQWWRWQNGLQFRTRRYAQLFTGATYGLACGVNEPPMYLMVTYNFGSTITASARAAMLALAHEFWLATSRCEDCDECKLPDSTINVVREGITYAMDDPSQDSALERTGVLSVDRWVHRVNTVRARARSAVYTPGSPPGVVRRLVGARPTWEV